MVGLKTNKLDGYFFCLIVMIKKNRKFYDCFFYMYFKPRETVEVTIEAKKIDETIVKIKFCIIENI